MEEHLLSHILTGEATTEEKEEFYRLLSNSRKEEELFYEVRSLWLRASMQNTTVDADKEFEKLWAKLKHQKIQNQLSVGKRIFRYAAIFILVISLGGAAGYLISKNKFQYPDPGIQKYTAMRGSVSIVEFQDNTRVWLNSDSKLTYSEGHKNKQRVAELTGEAYFEVTHKDDFPFIVHAGQIVVRDLGTTFNIKAYPEDNYIETSLVEGAADILTEDGKSILTLNPGESAMYYTKEKRIEIRSIESNVLSAWRDGKFVIRDQRLADIFKELSRWYGIEFQFDNQELRDYRFTGNIKKSTTANLVLKILKTSAGFNYRVIEKIDEPDLIIVY